MMFSRRLAREGQFAQDKIFSTCLSLESKSSEFFKSFSTARAIAEGEKSSAIITASEMSSKISAGVTTIGFLRESPYLTAALEDSFISL